MIGYDCGDAITHNPGFTRYGTAPGADRAVLDGGLAVAWTALDLAMDDTHRTPLAQRLKTRVREEYGRGRERTGVDRDDEGTGTVEDR